VENGERKDRTTRGIWGSIAVIVLAAVHSFAAVILTADDGAVVKTR